MFDSAGMPATRLDSSSRESFLVRGLPLESGTAWPSPRDAIATPDGGTMAREGRMPIFFGYKRIMNNPQSMSRARRRAFILSQAKKMTAGSPSREAFCMEVASWGASPVHSVRKVRDTPHSSPNLYHIETGVVVDFSSLSSEEVHCTKTSSGLFHKTFDSCHMYVFLENNIRNGSASKTIRPKK